MFGDCANLTGVSSLNDWNISNVTNFDMMFSR